jgi:serine/threonine-protein kinase TTK/MPS1
MVGGCLKLIDFGIAKAIPNDTTNIKRDHQSGTLNYMSPEAILFVEEHGEKQNYLKQGRASDVWSLGCILYRFVYLHPPFGNLPWMAKLRCIADPDHKIEYPPTEDKDVVDVLKGCLVYQPKKRLTIPQLLQHRFLNSGNSAVTKTEIYEILRMGLKYQLNMENIDQIVEVLYI